MPHGSTPDLSAPLPFGSDSPLIWDAPSPRVDAFQSFDPSFDYDAGDASGEEVFSPGWDQMGREAEDIRLGSTIRLYWRRGRPLPRPPEILTDQFFFFSCTGLLKKEKKKGTT